MRAHFAGDIVVTASSPVEDDTDDERIEAVDVEAAPEPPPSLDARIVDFKHDAKNMAELSEFIDEVLHKAETEVAKQQNAKNEQSARAAPKEKSRQSFAIPDFKNGKVVNRARGLVVRIFDAICNCANNAAAPAQRIKLRGKRASTNSAKTAAAEPAGVDGGDKSLSETKEKTKKLENGKEKKGDRKKVEELQVSVAE